MEQLKNDDNPRLKLIAGSVLQGKKLAGDGNEQSWQYRTILEWIRGGRLETAAVGK
jgi:hypothetical protein